MSSSMLSLEGSWVVAPMSSSLLGPVSGLSSISTPLVESLALAQFSAQRITLSSDSVTAVALGGLTAVNALLVKALDGKVRVRVTSADGSTQAVPVDRLLVLLADSVPMTAIDLMRVAGAETTVEVFLGQKA